MKKISLWLMFGAMLASSFVGSNAMTGKLAILKNSLRDLQTKLQELQGSLRQNC